MLDAVADARTWRGTSESEKAGPGHVRRSVYSSDLARAEPVWCGCRLGCTRWGAHWRNLMNTIEPSSCGGDAALGHITLTTCS